MTFKDRISFLTTPAEVDAFLQANPAAAIFKVGTCHKTQETFGHVQANLIQSRMHRSRAPYIHQSR